MCRVVLFNYEGFRKIERSLGLDQYFLELEYTQGGNGNGIALLYPDGHIDIKKGIDFEFDKCAELVREARRFSWCLFHTRLASAGCISDSNCHPFRVGDIVLAANGTEAGFGNLGKVLGNKDNGDLTDTEALLCTLYIFHAPMPSSLLYFSSVFMGFVGTRPFVVSGGYGDLEVYAKKGAKIFASQLPDTWTGGYMQGRDCFYWHGGKVPTVGLEPLDPKKRKKIGLGRYAYGLYGYEGFDEEDLWYGQWAKKKQKEGGNNGSLQRIGPANRLVEKNRQ